MGLYGGSYSTYAYADGDPIDNSDPLGLSPWGGLGGDISWQEAEALSIEQAFNQWWNSPDPCTKAYLEQRFGPIGTKLIGWFSLGSLTSGPWNMSSGGPQGAWGDVGETIAIKGLVGAAVNKVFPVAGPVATKAIGAAGAAATIWATYENFAAFIKSSGQCGCQNQ